MQSTCLGNAKTVNAAGGMDRGLPVQSVYGDATYQALYRVNGTVVQRSWIPEN